MLKARFLVHLILIAAWLSGVAMAGPRVSGSLVKAVPEKRLVILKRSDGRFINAVLRQDATVKRLGTTASIGSFQKGDSVVVEVEGPLNDDPLDGVAMYDYTTAGKAPSAPGSVNNTIQGGIYTAGGPMPILPFASPDERGLIGGPQNIPQPPVVTQWNPTQPWAGVVPGQALPQITSPNAPYVQPGAMYNPQNDPVYTAPMPQIPQFNIPDGPGGFCPGGTIQQPPVMPGMSIPQQQPMPGMVIPQQQPNLGIPPYSGQNMQVGPTALNNPWAGQAITNDPRQAIANDPRNNPNSIIPPAMPPPLAMPTMPNPSAMIDGGTNGYAPTPQMQNVVSLQGTVSQVIAARRTLYVQAMIMGQNRVVMVYVPPQVQIMSARSQQVTSLNALRPGDVVMLSGLQTTQGAVEARNLYVNN